MSLHLHRPHRAAGRDRWAVDDHLLTVLGFVIGWTVLCAAVVLHYAGVTR